MKLRTLLLNTHLIVGIAASPFLAILGATGAALVFESIAESKANAPATRVAPAGTPLSLDSLQARVLRTRPGATLHGIAFPERPDRAYQLDVSMPGARSQMLLVDPYSGNVLGRASRRTPLRWVHQLHTRLLVDGGSTVTGWAAVVMLFLACTGIILWWPLKIFRVRRGAARRVVLDLHAALGIYSWVFVVLFALTGIVVHWGDGAERFLARATGGGMQAPPPDSAPGCVEARLLGPDSLLAIARATLPGAGVTAMMLDASTPARVRLRYPEDHTPIGRTTVFVDGCTGRVLQAVSSRTTPAASRYVRVWNRQLHTGDVFGWPTRILAMIASLSLPLVALTGPLLWLLKRSRPARSTAGLA